MSRRLCACVVAAGLLSLTFAARGADLLVNPSFEEPGDQEDLAAGWSRWGDWINRETGWTPIHDGTCLLGYHHWQIEKNGTSGFYQDIENVTPGKTCTFSLYANADKVADGEQAPVSVEVRLETTVDGEQSTIISKRYEVSALAGGEEWSKLSVSAKVPAKTLRALVVITPGDGSKPRGGAIKFDDAKLSVQ